VGVLSSGSIVAGGQANDHGERYIWLVKVGSDGCLEEYSCGLVVTGMEEEVREGAGGMLVYPNPANSTVTIELKEGALSSDGLVVFFNAQGQEVLRKILPAKNRENTFSVEHLLPGLFYIEIKDSGHNTLQQSKLIINH
ncbi:MAG TPA: T9SS type A sorting domain-containing protein, partial [Bacteroidetes bacterium]|nr:T9SS type A sorting domain-containing protein [Bacteroidota bacterium]